MAQNPQELVESNRADGVEELLQAHSHSFHLVLYNAGAMTLECAVQLGIIDIIGNYDRPVTLSELASQLPISPQKVSNIRRLMRLHAYLRYFEVTSTTSNEEAYSLTSFSRVFLKDSPTSLASWLLGVRSPYLTDSWQLMSAWFQQEQHQSVFEMHHKKSIWELANENPEFNNLFNKTMDGDTAIVVKAVVSCEEAFEGVKTLVDVGGGNGTMARAIAETFPHINKLTVYDLPHVVATMPKSPLIDTMGGNMFEFIPEAQVLFMKRILHDWTDEDCVKILKMCKKAIPSKEDGGKVIVVDIVVNTGNDDPAMLETKLLLDMVMMTCTEGKEREEHEWKKIFVDAGYGDYKITPLGMHSLIEVFP